MAPDLFQTLKDTAGKVGITNLGDITSEWDTTQSCAETGCGGGPA